MHVGDEYVEGMILYQVVVFPFLLLPKMLLQESPYDETRVSEKQYGMNFLCKKNPPQDHQDVPEYLKRQDHFCDHHDHTRVGTQSQIDVRHLHYLWQKYFYISF